MSRSTSQSRLKRTRRAAASKTKPKLGELGRTRAVARCLTGTWRGTPALMHKAWGTDVLQRADRVSPAEAAQISSEAIFSLSRLVKAHLKKGLEPCLRGGPHHGRHTGIPPGRDFDVWRQAGVHEALGVGDRPLLKSGDAGRQRVNEPVQLGIRQRAVDVAIGL